MCIHYISCVYISIFTYIVGYEKSRRVDMMMGATARRRCADGTMAIDRRHDDCFRRRHDDDATTQRDDRHKPGLDMS